MFPDWNLLSNEQQLRLSHSAMRTAADLIANQADMLATEIEDGALADLGGPEALRLLAAIIRLAGPDAVCQPLESLLPCGHA